MKLLRNARVIGISLFTIIVGVACAIDMVSHPKIAFVGTTFRAVVTVSGKDSVGGTHRFCVGLGDSNAEGWMAAEKGWLTTQGTSSPASGEAGSATADPSSADTYNSEHPEFAPFQCWTTYTLFDTAMNRGDIYIDITVPEGAATGAHQLMWLYHPENQAKSVKTTSIEVISGPAVVQVVEEPAGDNCAQGGQRITTGFDGDYDGVPDSYIHTQYVCNGADGTNGTDGEDGTNGTDGEDGINGTDGEDGTNGTDGEDGTNGADGTNGTDGVDGTNGTNGFNALVNVVAEPAGSHCAAGGQRIATGLDDGTSEGEAGNGTLEDGEIDNSTYVCNGEPAPEPGGCSTTGGLTLPLALLLLAGVFIRKGVRVAR